jgi:diguanylate cyclase (GGDEF)-like protein
MSTKILVADDDLLSRQLLQGLLAQNGYQVTAVPDGATAWRLLQEEGAPRVAILDWNMPGMEGIEICRRLKQRQSFTPTYVILLTGRNSKADTVQGLQAGANDFLSKPYHAAELLARTQVGCTVSELQGTVQAMARRDAMTNLLNRHALAEELEREWSRSSRSKSPLTCVMIDIDYFKKINDVHGHLVGDVVIACVAEILRNGTRASDVVARYGGEEFCVLLPETAEHQAAIWGERIRKRIESSPFSTPAGELSITISLGIAERTEEMSKPTDMIEEADQGLLLAKQSGRNRIVTARNIGGARTELQAAGMQVPEHVLIAEIMTPVVATLSSQVTLLEATRFLLETRLDTVPVVDGQGRLVELLGEDEIVRRISGNIAWETRLMDCGGASPVCFDIRSSVASVFKSLMRLSVRRVVVMDGSQPVGILSRLALLRWLYNRAVSQQTAGAHGVDSEESPSNESSRESLRLVVQAMQRKIQGLSEKSVGENELESNDLLVSATSMQVLCEDILACARLLALKNVQHATLGDCLA